MRWNRMLKRKKILKVDDELEVRRALGKGDSRNRDAGWDRKGETIGDRGEENGN